MRVLCLSRVLRHLNLLPTNPPLPPLLTSVDVGPEPLAPSHGPLAHDNRFFLHVNENLTIRKGRRVKEALDSPSMYVCFSLYNIIVEQSILWRKKMVQRSLWLGILMHSCTLEWFQDGNGERWPEKLNFLVVSGVMEWTKLITIVVLYVYIVLYPSK